MSLSPIPVAAVLGHPINHSKSPKLHNYWLSLFNIGGYYIPLDIDPRNFENSIRALIDLGFVGANVTIPYKEKVLKIADKISDRAAIIGAANTLTFLQDGRIYADNTDGYGFLQNIKCKYNDWSAGEGTSVVFGAGGASRAILGALIEDGANEVILANRTRSRADQLRSDFGAKIKVVDWTKVQNYLSDASTVINATSLGMDGKEELPISLQGLRKNTLVTDIVYTPLNTPLLENAAKRGCRTVDGLGMLIHQAIPGFERWFGVKPDVSENLRELLISQ
ncbi:MAG: shikimate dehydrogenase [Paracoccaceae bacterium]|uniref:shikimate dehydrogenase n=1 Tax=Candidatus Salinivivens marinus TaxID=3381703 RepID=UPI000B6E9248|nr:shikimate dehydrogenase [Marinovum sp.]OUU12393.1 MAG: shikimate dehydrogenase [Rhodobacteraceae bacterium TMED38]PDH59197.1 MAG: shikimate dehydrogenase [Rhodobacteraceae bacterium MED-G08]